MFKSFLVLFSAICFLTFISSNAMAESQMPTVLSGKDLEAQIKNNAQKYKQENSQKYQQELNQTSAPAAQPNFSETNKEDTDLFPENNSSSNSTQSKSNNATEQPSSAESPIFLGLPPKEGNSTSTNPNTNSPNNSDNKNSNWNIRY